MRDGGSPTREAEAAPYLRLEIELESQLGRQKGRPLNVDHLSPPVTRYFPIKIRPVILPRRLELGSQLVVNGESVLPVTGQHHAGR